MRVALWRKLSTKELMLLNCCVGEDFWESFGLQGDSTSPFWRRSVLVVLCKDWCWSWNTNILAISCEELTHWKSWLIGKDSDAGRDWGQEKGTTEDEMAGWHHQLDGHEFGWTLRVGHGQGSLACYNSWDHKESDTIERLNWTETISIQGFRGFPHSSVGKESACNAGDPGSIPGRSPGEGIGYPFQYSWASL